MNAWKPELFKGTLQLQSQVLWGCLSTIQRWRKKMKGMSALLIYRSVLFDHCCSRMLAQWNHLLTRFDKTWMIDKSRPDRGQVTLAVPVCVGWILTLHRNMHNGRDIFIKKLKIPWPKSVSNLTSRHSHEFHPFYGRLTGTQSKAPTPSAHKDCRPPSHPSCRRVGFQTNSRGCQKVYEYAKYR